MSCVIFKAIGLALCGTAALAQGTLEFRAELRPDNVIPPTTHVDTGSYAQGSLTAERLELVVWASRIDTGLRTAGIYGPAGPTEIGPLIFDLGYRTGRSVDLGGGWSSVWSKPVPRSSLTGSQLNDLIAGRWYIMFSTDDFPDGAVRGQLLLVPESGTGTLLALGIFALGLRGLFPKYAHVRGGGFCAEAELTPPSQSLTYRRARERNRPGAVGPGR